MQVTVDGSVIRIVLVGNWDITSGFQATRSFQDVLRANPDRDVELDIANVGWISGPSVASVFSLAKRLRETGHLLTVVDPQQHFMMVNEVLHLDCFLTIRHTGERNSGESDRT